MARSKQTERLSENQRGAAEQPGSVEAAKGSGAGSDKAQIRKLDQQHGHGPSPLPAEPPFFGGSTPDSNSLSVEGEPDSTFERLRQSEENLRELQALLTHMARVATLGELVAEVGHEVSQPLYSILNYATACGHLLEQSSPDLKQLRQWNGEIAASAVRAGEVLRRMRDFVRRGSLSRQRVRVEELIEESASLLAFDFRRQRVAFRLEFGEGLCPVEVDPVQIQQVLVNLLRNALEAVCENREGDGTVWIRAVRAGDQIEVIVEDNGPGLPGPGIKVFEPFVTTKPEGLGMGLPISRRILESHGGRIWAADSLHGGAALHIVLPCYERESHGG